MAGLKVLDTAPPTRLATLVADFLASKRAAGNSPRTLAIYSYPLERVFLSFCAAQDVSAPDQVTQRVLDRLSTQLLEEGGARGQLSKASVSTYLRHINLFLRWAQLEGELPSAVKAQRPKLGRRILDVLSREEIQSLEDTADNERDKLIIRLLADTGIRLNELLSLRTGDLQRHGKNVYLRVQGKGELERLVPIPGLHRRLERFIERARPKDVLSDRLFVSRRRRGGDDYQPLTKSGVEQMLHVVGERAGIRKRVYPHLFRHSYATWSLRRGMNPLQLMQILGHTSLDMITSVYSHLVPSDAYEAMVKLLQPED